MESNCDCKDWKEGKSEIEGMIVMAYVHGQEYKGPFWKYCPWCGNKLKNQPPEESNATS